MNAGLESAFLAAVAPLPALSGIDGRTGVSGEDNGPESALVIVHCPDCDHVAGPLWRGTVAVRLETPAAPGSREGHDARLRAVLAWLDDREGVAAALESQGVSLRGYHVQKTTASTEGDRWVAEIEVAVGLEAPAGAGWGAG
jgi:hypothetical protein